MEREGSGRSQGQLKTCKGNGKQVESLLKAIRPKVYITDSSSFKKLVQELTGNGNNSFPTPSPSPSPSPTEGLHDHVPVITIEENEEAELCFGGENYGGVQLSVDSQDSGIHTLSPLAAFTALQTAWMTQQIDEFQYPDFDTWTMETDPPLYHGYSFETQDEILSCEYDLSEIYDML